MKTIRSGYTLVEVLASVGIIGLLIALILPAVQRAREAAACARCASSLKQLGVALHSYASQYQTFPMEMNSYANSATASGSSPDSQPGQYCSSLTRLLPFIEQENVFFSINFSLERAAIRETEIHPANFTAFDTTIGLLLCPSDAGTFPVRHGNNYVGNMGVGPAPIVSAQAPDGGNGFLQFTTALGPGSFPDGLAHTVAFSERLRGTGGTDPPSATRDFSNLDINPDASMRDADYALDWCQTASRVAFPGFVRGGETWFLAGKGWTSYCHAQEPNGVIPDAAGKVRFVGWGIATARSWHDGGVNALMGDGSVRFVNENIQRNVWRALGSRNGAEPVE